MAPPPFHVAPIVVVGAGVAGIVTVKICLEDRLNVICFEKKDSIGQGKRDDGIRLPPSAAFSDFPRYQANTGDFNDYVRQYAARFKLERWIRLRQEVVCVVHDVGAAGSHKPAGEWIVTTRDAVTGVESVVRAAAVLVCTKKRTKFKSTSPHHPAPLPGVSGLDQFRGLLLTVSSSRTVDVAPLAGKNVAVVGCHENMLNAAVDIGDRLGFIANQVYVAALPTRVNVPSDTQTENNKSEIIYVPNSRLQSYAGRWVTPKVADVPKMVLNQNHLKAAGTCKDDTIKERLTEVKEDTIGLNITGDNYNATVYHRVDVIILVVKPEHPNIWIPSLAQRNGNSGKHAIVFYEDVFPLSHTGYLGFPSKSERFRPPTLGFIGRKPWPDPLLLPLVELQARWAVRVIRRRLKVPPPYQVLDRMLKQAENENAKSVPTDYLKELDNLAKKIGCQLHPVHLVLTDPVVAWCCLFGPFVPHQYRLYGDRQWIGAREAIIKSAKKSRSLSVPSVPSWKALTDFHRDDTDGLQFVRLVLLAVAVFVMAIGLDAILSFTCGY